MDVIRAFIADPIPILKGTIPKIPFAIETILLHTLRLSETSKLWNIRLELTAKIMRSFVQDSPPSISAQQNFSLSGFPITNRMWISKVTINPSEENNIPEALFTAIEGLKSPGDAKGVYNQPDVLPVEAEWTGYCYKGRSKKGMSEEEKYRGMMKEAVSGVTILYFHGGGYYLMDPATHRPTTAKLAKYTKGRCLSIRYRLAPAHPFPACLTDALVSYLTLLYPPKGSLHDPVPASNIVFAGDSSGGNLSLVLLQTLLEFRRLNLTPLWNGIEREIPLPAGVAVNSAWTDITRSMPSVEKNAKFDYLPPPSTHPDGMYFPPCPLWPASPPRKNFFAEDEMLHHPLVSPLAAKDWSGSPPLWICTGQELLTDEDKHVAAKAARQGVRVQFEEWEGMPHCFCMILMNTMPSRKCFMSWAKFATLCVQAPEHVETRGTRIRAKSWKEEKLDVGRVSLFSDEVVEGWMRRREGVIEHIGGTDTLATI